MAMAEVFKYRLWSSQLLFWIQYITIQEFNKLTSENVTARVVKANLLSKNDIANFVKKTDRDDKLRYLNKDVPSDKKSMYLLKIY